MSVVVPLFNEERRLEGSVHRLLDELAIGPSDEIILVDDGSFDQTARILDELVSRHEKVRARTSEINRGKGHAVRMGISASRGDLVLIVDADLSASLKDFQRLFEAVQNGADIAIGSRAVEGSEVPVPQPHHRIVLGRISNLLLRALLPTLRDYKDTQCGFKLLRGEVARDLAGSLTIDRWGMDFELLHVARRRGHTVKEVPISWSDSGTTRVRGLDHFRTLKDLGQLLLNDARGRYGLPRDSSRNA